MAASVVTPVPPLATGSAPAVLPRPSAFRAPAAEVAPVPPSEIGSAPPVMSETGCLWALSAFPARSANASDRLPSVP